MHLLISSEAFGEFFFFAASLKSQCEGERRSMFSYSYFIPLSCDFYELFKKFWKMKLVDCRLQDDFSQYVSIESTSYDRSKIAPKRRKYIFAQPKSIEPFLTLSTFLSTFFFFSLPKARRVEFLKIPLANFPFLFHFFFASQLKLHRMNVGSRNVHRLQMQQSVIRWIGSTWHIRLRAEIRLFIVNSIS